MSLLPLHVDGNVVRDSQNRRVRLAGMDAFALFARWLMPNGKDAIVKVILDDWDSVLASAKYTGLKALRVFRGAAPPNEFALDPWSYRQMDVVAFMNYCLTRGYYVDWTVGDCQIIFPSGADGSIGINEHTNRFCAALAGLPNAIWNTCNEPFKNGVDVGNVKPPPWAPAVQYSGDYGDNRPDSHDLACINLHVDRSEEGSIRKWVGKAHESAPYLWIRNRPIWYDECMGADEVDIPGRRSNRPEEFRIMGTVITMVDAVYFHCTDGMGCHVLRPITRNCAIEFFKGAQVAQL